MASAALAIVSLIGIGVQAVQQRKIGKEQKKQNKLANKIAAIQRRRNVKRSIAASRIQVAQQQALGFRLGVGGSTAVQGATAGVLSDTASAVGASNLQFTGQQFQAQFADNISGFQETSALAGAVSNVAGGVANNPKALEALTSLVG
jgi:hypothetical protein